MNILNNMNDCTGCTACYTACPQKCITMQKDEAGFLYPMVNEDKCIKCGKCQLICPQQHQLSHAYYQKAYYGWHKDETIRHQSSSGGAFTAIAEYFLSEGGIVYGTSFDYETRSLRYTSTKQVTLNELRKSKYVQGELGEVISQIEEDLKQGKKVLFVGTPCHVHGVKCYFNKKNYDQQLFLCDFICHGVPSNQILQSHIKHLENKYHSKLLSIDFRPKTDKQHPWWKHHLKLVFDNGRVYDHSLDNDWYMYAFMKKSLTLRKSCYQCHYCNAQHEADITLADFWGIMNYNPTLNDEKGLSLIILNTSKAEGLIKHIKENFNLYPLKWEFVKYVFKKRTQKNYSLDQRKKFMKNLQNIGYFPAMIKYIGYIPITSKLSKLIYFTKTFLVRMRKIKHLKPIHSSK